MESSVYVYVHQKKKKETSFVEEVKSGGSEKQIEKGRGGRKVNRVVKIWLLFRFSSVLFLNFLQTCHVHVNLSLPRPLTSF